jgi:hypothetical protein
VSQAVEKSLDLGLLIRRPPTRRAPEAFLDGADHRRINVLTCRRRKLTRQRVGLRGVNFNSRNVRSEQLV